jgi:hypothetical protein
MAQAETRKQAAIMLTDIADFSRQLGADEARTSAVQSPVLARGTPAASADQRSSAVRVAYYGVAQSGAQVNAECGI